MIVTFRTMPQGGSDHTAAYINFLRCVTAIATANAGTTSLTVNPYTGSNAINTSFNCIVSIDNNSEAGGWITSASHNVPSSANNVATTFTALAASTPYLYKADFYKESGKAIQPYYKLCFHSYNDFVGTANWGYTEGVATTLRFGRSAIVTNAGANMLITYGSSSTTDWTSTTFPPAAGSTTLMWNQASQSTSYTMNGDMFSALVNNGPGLCYNNTAVQYKMAVGADYCIIWEELIASTFTTGPFHSTTTGAGTTNWNSARYGCMYYMGTRETQPWEDDRGDNPPWVAWNITINNLGSGSAPSPWAPDGVCAYMSGLSSNGIAAAPNRNYAQNARLLAYFNGLNSSTTSNSNSATGPGVVDAVYRQCIDVPIFEVRNWGAGVTGAPGYFWNTNSANYKYQPLTDPISGTLVPGAYPIMIKSSNNSSWNQGGKCKGIYKSLSMPWADMKRYWQAPNQTFQIDGVTYLPVVIYEDMWLVKLA